LKTTFWFINLKQNYDSHPLEIFNFADEKLENITIALKENDTDKRLDKNFDCKIQVQALVIMVYRNFFN
jgi:hypothetical protein